MNLELSELQGKLNAMKKQLGTTDHDGTIDHRHPKNDNRSSEKGSRAEQKRRRQLKLKILHLRSRSIHQSHHTIYR